MSSPFENLEMHAGTVYCYALRLTGRPDAAEDLTQETLLRGSKHRHALREERTARLWLLKITHNLWSDGLRRQKLRLERSMWASAGKLPAQRPTTARRSCWRWRRTNRRRGSRQVLYLVTCEELSNAEVAEVLAIPLGAVKSDLSLARKEMRRRLRDVYEATRTKRVVTKP